MRRLLDDDLLNGAHEVTTRLRPERPARPLFDNDVQSTIDRISYLSQVWSGSTHPLIPIDDAPEVPACYVRCLAHEQIDFIAFDGNNTELKLPPRVRQDRAWDYPTLLVAAHEPKDRWRDIVVTTLDNEDPWKPIYAATLGLLPAHPDTALADFVGHSEDLAFEDVLPVRFETTNGSLDDLLSRLTDRTALTPRQLSTAFLAAGAEPDTSYFGGNDVIPSPFEVRRAAGPNIVVAVSPGCSGDIALLWNLRAAHGDRRPLPIGVPKDELSAQALRKLSEPGTATMFGWAGGRVHVVSTSLNLIELTGLASTSTNALVLDYEQLLTLGHAPGRPQSHVALFTDGQAQLRPLTESDREVLQQTRAMLRQPNLVLDCSVTDFPLPTDPTLRGTTFGSHFQAGEAQVSINRSNQSRTVTLNWPSSWTALAAVARTHGLIATPSDPGLAAMALIRSIGGTDAIRLLLHRPLIELLYRLAERSGMSWWKARWSAAHKKLLAAGMLPETIESVAEEADRDEPAVAPAGEGRSLPFEDFRKALGDVSSAQHWVLWAENHHLLVRGTDIRCSACGATSWLPMASVPPPVGCVGCGRVIDQPYGPRDLKFTYRIGESLRRVLETDSLGHIIALHWLTKLFRGPELIGAHPGVTFTPRSDSNVTRKASPVGEADVLLMFSDSSLVPVEVKRRPNGLDKRAIALVDKLSDILYAPFDILAISQPARLCPNMPPLEQRLPARPRLLLTDDQMHDPFPIWSMGSNPFAWAPWTEEQDRDRYANFARRVAEGDLDTPFTPVRLFTYDLDSN